MPNVNKVIYGDQTLVDMTDATADASKIARGYTAYLADGSKATGTLDTSNSPYYLGQSPETEGMALFYDSTRLS
jgi:hypothetical protein